MGYNSTLVILNDALHQIEEDKEFGYKVAQAVRQLSRGEQVNISSGFHANAATAVETHHADGINLIAVGGNMGLDLGWSGSYRAQPVDLLKILADRLGYRIVKKTVKQTVSQK